MIRNKKAGAGYVIISADQENRRIDNFMIRELGHVPKSRIYQMLRRGEIRVNGGRIKQDYRLQAGDKVRIPPVFTQTGNINAVPGRHLVEMVGNSVIFENENMIVLNKPAGIVVHGGSGRSFGVIEVLRYLRPQEPDLQLVHRLDRETSGCLIIAKNYKSLKWLHEEFKAGKIGKEYITLVKGKLGSPSTDVDKPLQRNLVRSGERVSEINDSGKQALTRFVRIKQFEKASLARVILYTGRTHQIRAHAAHIRHPVAGDAKYGDREFNSHLRKLGLKRMFLHAQEVRIPVPGKEDLVVNAPLPEGLEKIINIL